MSPQQFLGLGRPVRPTIMVAQEPIFQLAPRSVVFVEGEECQIERGLSGGRWQLLHMADQRPFLLTNAKIAQLMARGEFYAQHERGMRIFAPPPSPLSVGPEAHKNNARKHSYVTALLADGDLKRSRSRMMPVIRECAADRGEEAPGFTTVLSWLDEYERFGALYGTAAYSDRHDLKGKRGSKLPEFQERAIERGLEAWQTGQTKANAYSLVFEAVRELQPTDEYRFDFNIADAKFFDCNGLLRPPSLRTFERRCEAINRWERDWSRVGPAYAKQRRRSYPKTILPDRPYQHVDVDDCTLDIILVSSTGLALGRANVVVFRDRATAMIVGLALGFTLACECHA